MSDRYDVWVRPAKSNQKWKRRFRHYRTGRPRAHKRNWNLTVNQTKFRSRREKDRAVKELKEKGYSVKSSLSVTPGDRIVYAARKHIGVKESPPGSNKGKLVTKWLKQVGYNQPGPWCAAFASSMAEDAGYPLRGGGSASVYFLRQRAEAADRFVKKPERGYLGTLPNDAHIVIVEAVNGSVVSTIEGNTSASNGSNYNGGEVARHKRDVSDFVGFIKTG